MIRYLAIQVMALLLAGLFITGCSFLPPTQDTVSKSMSPAERMAVDEEDDSYWD